MVFYKQVLSKTGFDKYKVIDVQYKGQVVASKYAGNAKVDSVQLRKMWKSCCANLSKRRMIQ